ncbi:hypothetical protein AN396_01950 [Candidatus Epulonipiscium fishelsonii]|uniref:Uncharacterized protein n=1 Tax=Candidatus Epulonipiscium fishelsonii TaxID=77094 RepID=A0ACC8XFS5_9FIRM|nr:hypothetical protein AN396_01950 [Epulopiscium sp. SCG-B11WGA-EpuloA1]
MENNKKSKRNNHIIRKERMGKRVRILASGYILITLGLLWRIGYIQVVEGKKYSQKVLQSISGKEVTIHPLRGLIVDRNNKVIASSTITYNIILDPYQILNDLSDEQRQETSKALATFMNKPVEEIENFILLNPNSRYKILLKNISLEEKKMLEGLHLSGIWYEQSFIRNYPRGQFASQLIGFYNKEKGQYGIEQFFEKYLKGKDGRVYPTLQQGDVIMTETVSPVNGATVVLTIDEVIQQYIEKIMTSYIERLQPLNAAAIAMNPKTGEIYGMFSYPSVNPQSYTNLISQVGEEAWYSLSTTEQAIKLNEAWKNYNIHTSYEPGSTFKPLMVAAALEEGYLDPDTFVVNCTGSIDVFGTNIKCWDRYGHGQENLAEVLANSCNPGVISIANEVPSDIFLDYMKKFGAGELTGVDLPAEAQGLLHSIKRFGPVEKATASMGQTFMITPLQLITGFSALINGGYLLEPYVVSQVVGETIIYENTVNIKRQVISNETSKEITEILEKVISDGTGREASITGYQIGGKTGTAEKGFPRNPDKEILSFIGYAPIQDPEIILLIIFDEIPPQINVGGQIPRVFNEILTPILPYLGIQNKDLYTPTLNVVTIPNLVEKDIYTAIETLNEKDLNYNVKGGGNIIFEQYPPAGTNLPQNFKVTLYTDTDKPNELINVPYLIGLSIEDAKEILGESLKIEGAISGEISSQIPKANTKIEKNSKIIVQTMN